MVSAMDKASPSQLVVAWIFMEQAGEDRSRHVSADAVVSKGGTVAFSVGAPSLAPLFWIIFRLGNSSESAVERECGPIKNTRGGQPEFLSRGKRGKLLGVFDRPIVRQDLEDAVVHRSCFLLQFAFTDRGTGFVFVLIVL